METDGIVQIRFRTEDLNSIKSECLDGTGNLKVSHPYYYQMQGTLDMTEKIWYDFVIIPTMELK